LTISGTNSTLDGSRDAAHGTTHSLGAGGPVRYLRMMAKVAGVLLVVVVAGIGMAHVIAGRHIGERMTVAGHDLVVGNDSVVLARGERVATALGKCAECHGPDLGGKQFVDIGPVMTLYATNLTRGEGGIGAAYSPRDWERALRHGVAPDGRKLLFMPSHEYRHLADDDMAALVAYLQTRPAVDRRHDAPQGVGPIGRVLYLKGDMDLLPAELIDQAAAHRPLAPTGADVLALGQYMIDAGGCRGCHGPTLSGGPIPGAPPEMPVVANITPTGIGHYTEAQFRTLMREGRRPSGAMIDTVNMPVRYTRLLTDEEIAAAYAYLKTVPPKAYGGR